MYFFKNSKVIKFFVVFSHVLSVSEHEINGFYLILMKNTSYFYLSISISTLQWYIFEGSIIDFPPLYYLVADSHNLKFKII